MFWKWRRRNPRRVSTPTLLIITSRTSTHGISNSYYSSNRPRRTTLGTNDLPTRTQEEVLSCTRTLSRTYTAHSRRMKYHCHDTIYSNTAFISPICQTKNIGYVLILTWKHSPDIAFEQLHPWPNTFKRPSRWLIIANTNPSEIYLDIPDKCHTASPTHTFLHQRSTHPL